MPKIAQNVDTNSLLCYNNSIRNGGNYSYISRKIKEILFNLYLQLPKNFNMTFTASASDYFADYFLSWKETIAWTKSSESSLRRAIKNGTFPKPEPLFKQGGRVGFKKPDLISWAEGKRNW